MKLKNKIVEIRPYTKFSHHYQPTNTEIVEENGDKLKKEEVEEKSKRGESSPIKSNEKKRNHYSLHFQYRKKRQE